MGDEVLEVGWGAGVGVRIEAGAGKEVGEESGEERRDEEKTLEGSF